MENANDEFTWLSGTAHRSIVREAQSGDPGKRSPTTAKPLPHPRHQNVQNDPANRAAVPLEKPTPLPRAAPRTTSRPVYEVPPSLPNSVFYVATPKTSDREQRPSQTLPRVDQSVILEFDPIYKDQRSTSVFYIDSVAGNLPKKCVLPSGNTPASVTDNGSFSRTSNSVLTSSVKNSASNSRETLRVNGPPEHERKTALLNPIKVNRSASSSSSSSAFLNNSTLSSTSSVKNSASNSRETLRVNGPPEHERKTTLLNPIKVNRSASSSSSSSVFLNNSTLSSTASAPANFRLPDKENLGAISAPTTPVSTQVPTLATTSLPKNYCLTSDTASDATNAISERGKSNVEGGTDSDGNCRSLSRPSALLQSQVSPDRSVPVEHTENCKRPTPIPKPRTRGACKTTSPESLPRTNANKLKCTLSTVPPPPPPQSFVRNQAESETHPIVRESISVENPFYMLVEGGGAVTNSYASEFPVFRRSDSESSSCSSSTGSDFESLPPAFPPPPLPPASNNRFTFSGGGSGLDAQVFFTDLFWSQDVMEPTTPLEASVPKPNGETVENLLAETCSLPTEQPSADDGRQRMAGTVPLYQNLMELYNSAREGVYAKINKIEKPAVVVVAPPPLPPRQRQQQVPPPPPCVYPHPAPVIQMLQNENNPSDASTTILRESILDERQEPGITHHGVLFKIGRGRKDIVQQWIQLECGNLLCYADDTQNCLQEMYHKSGIISIAKGASSKLSQELSCFELVVQPKDRVQVFGARYLSECEVWIKLIVQTLAPAGAGTSSRGLVKAGKVEVRNSVTGIWQRAWFVLCGKQLEVCVRDEAPILLDLRKVILLQDFDKDPRMSDSDDGSPIFLINYPANTLYVRTSKSFDTRDWSHRIRQIMKDTGSGLDEQQLTHDDVPVIIYKCIEFVSTFGMTSQGIYRQSATNSRIAKLLDSFRKDAQSVRLQQGADGDNFTEHEVANALKRYLRTLPDSLLTSALYQQWIAVAAAGSTSVENLIILLHQLPDINYKTLKKIIAHLYSVSRHSEENLMTITNLAQVFGPTLFSDNDENIPNAHLEMDITSCLITNYPALFGVSAEEIEKEEQFQKALRDLREAKKTQKPAGDILVGVYIHDRHWGKCLNVKLSPTMTALHLCKFAVSQTVIRDSIKSLSVFEVVCNGHLERPLHFSENVLTVILRWASWADVDAKDNYLVIKRNELFPKILPLTRQPLSMFGELRFADNKSKNFKKLMFEFKNARLAYYKDAKLSEPLFMWNIEDITWYIGAEYRRPPPNNNLPNLSLTFIEHNAIVKRGSKESPYFGHTISFSLEEEFFRWLAAMLVGQYPTGILARNAPVNLL